MTKEGQPPTLDELRLYHNATMGQALLGFQLIEEGLKQYIALAQEIMRRRGSKTEAGAV